MSYKPAITIRRALENVSKNEFLLPAIQREFVWKEEQICHLFDSLMQGYPIGSFLFWKVEKEHSKEYVFYRFLTHYHQFKARHNERHDMLDEELVVAILDGQQRLTALNIGLRGTYATKLPRFRWNNPDAYPVRRLYLNIAGLAEENDLKMMYDFRFLTDEQAQKSDDGRQWFPVSQILELESGPAMLDYLTKAGVPDLNTSFKMLDLLYNRVHRDGMISAYDEEAQNLDKVLNIFIRVNSGGTKLSYSDLLLSIATAQWKEIDAREAINEFVDDLNGIRYGFNFSKDVVLKAGLALSDIPSISFNVTNFNARNMKSLEENWTPITRAIRMAVHLLASFGFSAQTLSADSVLIPIAYYLLRRDVPHNYVRASAFEADRELIRRWVIRSLLKPSGIWGSGLDTLLLTMREAIQRHSENGFPVDALEVAMARRGKSLRFDAEEIEDLLDLRYGDKKVFPLLALLYPGFDFHHEFHIDHVFPRGQFTAKRLAKAGVDPNTPGLLERVDMLPNLQLLEGVQNVQKKSTLPAEWLAKKFKDTDDRGLYISKHDLGRVPAEIQGFDGFFAARRNKMKARLFELLSVEQGALI